MGRVTAACLAAIAVCLGLCSCLMNPGVRLQGMTPPPPVLSPNALDEYRTKTCLAQAASTESDTRAILGEPDFALSMDSEAASRVRLLDRLGAQRSIHYFHPRYATVSLAVGLQGNSVTRSAMVSVADGTAFLLVDVTEFWRAEDDDRPVGWK